MPNDAERLTMEELLALQEASRGYVIHGRVERMGAGPDNTLSMIREIIELRAQLELGPDGKPA